MYQKFFQLKYRPFSATPDPRMLYQSASMRLALVSLEQSLRSGEGIGLLTAGAGTGKTLICKVLAERLAHDPLPVLLLNSSYATRSSLLQAVLFELGRPYTKMSEQELRLELVAHGRQLAQAHTGIALIVDEAHLLGEHILEELRSLMNFQFATRPIFRVMLSGQLPLEDLLSRRSLEAVNQRLQCHVTLELLNRQESLEYIITRVEQAGGQLLDLFTESALELIIHAADGLPRCLNQLCDHACLLASVAGRGPVDPSIVKEALEDLQKLPLHWNIPLPATDPLTQLKGDRLSAEIAPPTAPLVEQSAPDKTDDSHTVAELEVDFSGALTESDSTESTQVEAKRTPAEQAKRPDEAVSPTNSVTTAYVSEDGETSVIEIGGPPLPSSVSSSGKPPESTPVEHDLDQSTASAECSFQPMDADDEELELLAEELAADCQWGVPRAQRESTPVEEHAKQPSPAVTAPPPPRSSREIVQDRYALLDARRMGQLERLRNPSRPPAAVESHEITATAAQPESPAAQPDDADVAVLQQELREETQTQPGSFDLEMHVAQGVLDIAEDLAGPGGVRDEDAYPTPDQLLRQAVESQYARHDVVHPATEPEDYQHLYADLRRRQTE